MPLDNWLAVIGGSAFVGGTINFLIGPDGQRGYRSEEIDMVLTGSGDSRSLNAHSRLNLLKQSASKVCYPERG